MIGYFELKFKTNYDYNKLYYDDYDGPTLSLFGLCLDNKQSVNKCTREFWGNSEI